MSADTSTGNLLSACIENNMPLDIPNNIFASAVREYWSVRDRQATNQGLRGTSGAGNRSAVTGGAQMDGFVRTIADLLVKAGVPLGDIHYRMMVTALPGFFRPTKRWDMVIVSNGVLLAALELKSQVGSLGNNFNNRTEEAMGSALDIWTAYREGAFGDRPQPWLGYLFMLEDSPRARSPIKVEEPHFPVFTEFQQSSYAKRYELFCRRLVRERHYTIACLLLSRREDAEQVVNYEEPADDLSATQFIDQLVRHVEQRSRG